MIVTPEFRRLRKEESKLKVRLANTAKLYLRTNRGWSNGSVLRSLVLAEDRAGPQHSLGDS